MRIHPIYKESVGFLYFFAQGQYRELGTCFFVAVSEDNFVFVYIVTCKHVVKPILDQGAKLFVRLNRSDKKEVGFIELGDDWIYHVDEHVDIAVLPYSPNMPDPYEFMALPVDDIFLTPEYLRLANHVVGEGDPIMFMGLFTQITGTHRNLPIMRYGKVAMVTDELIDGGEYGLSDYILVECTAYPGNSGSPTYVGFIYKERPTVFLLGVMTGIYLEQVIWVGMTGQAKTYHNTGISLVVPIHKVTDILNGDILMKRRKDKVGGAKLNNKPSPVSAMALEDGTSPLQSEEFIDILKKASRPDQPSPDEETSET